LFKSIESQSLDISSSSDSFLSNVQVERLQKFKSTSFHRRPAGMPGGGEICFRLSKFWIDDFRRHDRGGTWNCR